MKNKFLFTLLLLSIALLLYGCGNLKLDDESIGNESLESNKEDTDITNVNMNTQTQNDIESNKEFETFKLNVMSVIDTYDVLWEEFLLIKDLVEEYPNLYKEDLIYLSSEYQLLSNSVLTDIDYMALGSPYRDRIKNDILYPLQEACMHKGNALYSLMRTLTKQEDASNSVKEQFELSNQKFSNVMMNLKKFEESFN